MTAVSVCRHDKTYPCEFCLEERIADLERQLAAVREWAEKLAESHVSGTWQGLVRRELDRILGGKGD